VIWGTLRTAVDLATHMPRYREILRVLFKYGFADVLKLVLLERLLGTEGNHQAPPNKSDLENPIPVRLRRALEELGPTFIKFGQMLSSRRDLITDDYHEELCKLQDSVPTFPTAEARRIIEEGLDQPIEKLFSSFDSEPIAAASIAQVYRANLLDGTEVAVKVRRPGITKIIEQDTAILMDFAGFLERHVTELAGLNPRGIVHEFIASLYKEIDFENEASNAERFREQFEGTPHIIIPEIYGELTTPRVLTMDFIKGQPINRPAKLRELGVDTVVLSENITDLIYEMIFIHGFFHGDPHPGNMTVLKDGVIGLYDYGMMGTLNPTARESVATLVIGLGEKNHQLTMRAIFEMSEEGTVEHPEKMLAEVESFSEEHLNRPLREINLAHVFNKLLALLRNNHLRLKSSFYMGIKALGQIQNIGVSLNSDLNFILMGEPFATRMLRDRFTICEIWRLIGHLAGETADFLKKFPYDFRIFYENLKRGKCNIPLQHKIDSQGFEPLRKTLDSIANRLTNAILTAAVLICSSIMALAHVPPLLNNVSFPGALGLCFGAYMCLRLLFSIWRHGGL
jgi:ubiquinone biosynthesis protein